MLRASDLARWSGLTLSYSDACDLDLRHSLWDHPSVGFISQGSARWNLRRGLVTTETQIGHGLAGVFGADFEYARSTWICRNARRVVAQILPADYARFGLEDELMQRRIDHRLAVHDPALTGVLRAMVAEVDSGCAHGALYAESLSAGLIRHVHRRYGETPGAARSSERRLTAVQLSRVREFVGEHLDGALSLKDLALAAGVGTSHFPQLFRSSVGESPYRYVLKQRMVAACRLLETTELGLTDVALATGFSSHSHFSSVFAREIGVPPRAYRAQTSC